MDFLRIHSQPHGTCARYVLYIIRQFYNINDFDLSSRQYQHPAHPIGIEMCFMRRGQPSLATWYVSNYEKAYVLHYPFIFQPNGTVIPIEYCFTKIFGDMTGQPQVVDENQVPQQQLLVC